MAMVKKVVDGKEIEEDDGVIREVKCFGCKNLLMYPACMAYPEKIPQDIRNGMHDHTVARGDEEKDAKGNPYIFTPFDQ